MPKFTQLDSVSAVPQMSRGLALGFFLCATLQAPWEPGAEAISRELSC